MYDIICHCNVSKLKTVLVMAHYIYYKACLPGNFGKGCRERCSGHCQNNASCDHISGVCMAGCEDGYIESRCNNCKEKNYSF